MKYQAPVWLPGGNLQTIWPALYARRWQGPPPHFRRERWSTPDADFIDVDWLVPQSAPASPGSLPVDRQGESARGADAKAAGRVLLVLFHGLEGSSSSHYAQAFADFAQARGLAYAVPHFRGCSGEINLAPRAYHSGDYEEIDWILQRFRRQHAGPLIAVGVSLGGNALLRWVAERQSSAARVVDAVASVCAPLDLAAGGHAVGRGFNRRVYTPMFLRTMKPKALRMLQRHPRLFDGEALRAVRDLHAFDDLFTAPVHGFRNADDYWTRASAKPHLARIAVPALILNARNDPFVPSWSLPQPAEVSRTVELWQPTHGGHVGFPQGRLPGHLRDMPEAVGSWLLARAGTVPQQQGAGHP